MRPSIGKRRAFSFGVLPALPVLTLLFFLDADPVPFFRDRIVVIVLVWVVVALLSAGLGYLVRGSLWTAARYGLGTAALAGAGLWAAINIILEIA